MASTDAEQASPVRKKNMRQSLGEENSDSIKVVCRFRPYSDSKGKRSQEKISSFNMDTERGVVEFLSEFSDSKQFTFDQVFDTDSTQSQVYEEVKNVVESVMSGFNGCLMAYGQTSAGKSWTMEGPSLWDTEYQGAIPRCVDGLFNAIDEADEDIEFQVTVSYFEIYCEKVRDLLNPSMCNLKVRETRADGFIVQDVTEVFCTDRENVLRVIELGKANRASAPTLMNAESSRSHSIVTMVVEQKDSSTGRKKRGMMFLVDLAGSEKVSKTGASGMRLEEAKNINRSLTTLGMVINSLCDGASHVPYRDSSLTLILKDALGGNSKTTLIICCNPESRHTPETLSTLRFGERAKRIKNNARINEEYSVDELKVMLQAARKEIEQLKKKLALYTGGGDPASPRSSQSMLKRSFSSGAMLTSGNSIEYVGSSNYEDALTSGVDQVQRDIDNLGGSVDFEDEELLTKMTELQEAKRQKEEEIVDLRARITSLEEELDDERIRWKSEHEQYISVTSESDALRSTIAELEAKLVKSNLELKRTELMRAQHSPSNKSREGPESAKTRRSIEQDDADNNNPNHIGIHDRTGVPDDNGGSGEDCDRMEALIYNANNMGSKRPPSIHLQTLSWEERMGGENEIQYSAENAGIESIEKRFASTDEYTSSVTVNDLEESGDVLKSKLEVEINQLQSKLSAQESDAITVKTTAETYAEKYMLMREDYEKHVQRLMHKLMQEQQARVEIEDKLEEAMHRLWRESEGASSKPKSFFSAILSGSLTYPKNRRFSATGNEFGVSHSDLSERERNFAKALESAKSRVIQLVSELESTREAQLIVLETKESVMRSLVKQNSQLTIERDTLNKRVDDMQNTVEQLTNLLRSVQTRTFSDASPLHSTRSFNKIQGGGSKAHTFSPSHYSTTSNGTK